MSEEITEEIKATDLLTDEETAKYLKVSPRTVQRLRLAKKIKSCRVTAKISRIRGEHVLKYLKDTERASLQDVQLCEK